MASNASWRTLADQVFIMAYDNPVGPGTDPAGARAIAALRSSIETGLEVASSSMVLTVASLYLGTVSASQIVSRVCRGIDR